MFKYEKCKLCPCINCKLSGCIIHNTTIFCSINSTDFYIILWLTVVGVSLQKFFIQKLLHKFTLANQTSPMARFLWCSLNCSPVKKCDTYGIFVLFADYKFIISTKDKIQIERLIFKRDINDVPYTCES